MKFQDRAHLQDLYIILNFPVFCFTLLPSFLVHSISDFGRGKTLQTSPKCTDAVFFYLGQDWRSQLFQREHTKKKYTLAIPLVYN